MRVLSSKWTAFTRAYSLRVWVAGSAIVILIDMLNGSLNTDRWNLVNLVFVVVFGVLLSRFIRTLVDTVNDGGDHLLVSRDGQVDRVPLEHIVDVEAGYLINSGKVVLHLSPPCEFGEQIAFVPCFALSFTGVGASPIAHELLRRAQAARAKSAA